MNNQWNGSEVMGEFAKIAAEQGLITSDLSHADGKPFVGNPDKETPVKDHRRYEPTEEYGITKETGEDLVHEAHPEDVEPAEGMGEGGLVENVVQQQKKDIEVATQMPSGALVGKHAELIQTLIKLANNLEGEGKVKAAERVDVAIERIARYPFDGGLQKEAFWGALIAPLKYLIWGGAVAGAASNFGPALVSKLTSTREDLATDIQDVLEAATKVREANPTLSAVEEKLQTLLSPYVVKFRQPIPAPGDEAGLNLYVGSLSEFAEKVLPDVKEIITVMTAVKGGWWENIGAGPKSRLEEKFKDMMETFKETLKATLAAAKIGKTQIEPAKIEISGISTVQDILSERGFNVPKTGQLDDATKNALRNLELQLEKQLAPLIKQRDWTVSGKILHPDGTVMEAQTLRRLLTDTDEWVAKRLK